jgi:hypothetical protein
MGAPALVGVGFDWGWSLALWALWEGWILLMLARLMLISTTVSRLRLDRANVTLTEASPFRVISRTSAIEDFDVMLIDFADSQEGGVEHAPIHHLWLKFGAQVVPAFQGHRPADLAQAQAKLVTRVHQRLTIEAP